MKLATAAALVALSSVAVAPVAAQYQNPPPQNAIAASPDQRAFQAGYQRGYRTGYKDGQDHNRFDDVFPGGYRGDYRGGGYPDRDERFGAWQRRYSRAYTYNDDMYYQQCRNGPDPAGVLTGAVIGGLIGNSVTSGDARVGGTAAGIIIGGAVGAGLTRNQDCGDRSYAYRGYYDAFNADQASRQIAWRNPNTGHQGSVVVDRYYVDPDGFRCANFRQTTDLGYGKYKANGVACQQPDGSWVVVR